MEKDKTYKFVKNFKVENTTGFTVDLKGKLFSYNNETPSYYIINLEGHSLPYLISKQDIDLKIGKSILQVDEKLTILNIRNAKSRVSINEHNLLGFGFKKVANLYIKGRCTLQLIKGHTWHLSEVGDKFGKDVKYLDELN